MVKAYVINGLGIGCDEEVAHAYEKAGAKVEMVHFRQLLSMSKDKLFEAQIINLAGGFLHGDFGGAGMYAANELEHSGIKDLLIEFADEGNVIYGQCNGFQFLVKTGLLPGINSDYSKQILTLTHNDCGNYRVAPVMHKADQAHFAFKGIDMIQLWCRHAEGKGQFNSKYGSVSEEEGEKNRQEVNKNHVILRYVDNNGEPTEKFPFSPNGSIDGIAGLANFNGHIFGNMAHPEVSIYSSRDPDWFVQKDRLRRQGIKAKDLEGEIMEGQGLKIFRNIVNYVK